MSKERTRTQATESQKAYAKNITNSFPSWAIYGSGGNAAAKKIIKEVSKNEKDKILEAIQAAMNTPATGGGAPTPVNPPAAHGGGVPPP